MGILIVLLGLSFIAMLAVPELLVLVCVIEYRRMRIEPIPALQPAVVSTIPYVVPSLVTYRQPRAA
jgi:hypothetical protein